MFHISVAVTWFLLLVGLFIEILASFLGVMGLQTIFGGSVMLMMLIGIGIESAKVLIPIWLTIQHNISKIRKILLWSAVILLMLINAVSVYGSLTRFSRDVFNRVTVINNEIKDLELRIESIDQRIEPRQKTLDQFDRAMDVYINKDYVTRGLRERRKDEVERNELFSSIEVLRDEQLEMRKSLNKLIAERTRVEGDFGALRELTSVFVPNPNEHLQVSYLIFIFAIMICFQPLGLMMVRSSVSELTDPTSETAKFRKKQRELAAKRKVAEKDIQSKSKFLLQKQEELELKERILQNKVHTME